MQTLRERRNRDGKGLFCSSSERGHGDGADAIEFRGKEYYNIIKMSSSTLTLFLEKSPGKVAEKSHASKKASLLLLVFFKKQKQRAQNFFKSALFCCSCRIQLKGSVCMF